jgi:hypothetical protein
MKDLCYYLRRSERSVWRHIKDAKAKGYFFRADYSDGIFTIEYRGLKSLAKHLGLTSIGAIGQFPLVKIQHAKVLATDLATMQLQSQSEFKRKEATPKVNRPQLRGASELLDSSSPSARVPGGEIYCRGKRLLYLLSGWIPFGASQKGVAERVGCSVRTIQHRLSNAWREERGIAHLSKLQTAHEVLSDCPDAFLKDAAKAGEDISRLVRLGKRVFQVGCNLYDIPIELRNQRFRQREYWTEQGGEVRVKPDEAAYTKGAKRRRTTKTSESNENSSRSENTTSYYIGGASFNSFKDFDFNANSKELPESRENPNSSQSARL